MSFPGGAVKSSPCHAGDTGDVGPIPGSGRYPGGGNPPQCSCLGNPMDRGAWQTAVHGAAKFWTQASRVPLAEPRLRCRSIGTTDVGGGDRTRESSVGKLGQGSTAAGEIRRRQSRADRAQEYGEGPDSGLGTGRGFLPGIWVASSSGQPSKVFGPPCPAHRSPACWGGLLLPCHSAARGCSSSSEAANWAGRPPAPPVPSPLCPARETGGRPPLQAPGASGRVGRDLGQCMWPQWGTRGGEPHGVEPSTLGPRLPTARSYPEEPFLPADWEIKVP